MENFPDDILLQIFSYLRKTTLCLGVRMTCGRWWCISKDASLWKELVIPVHFTDQRFTLLMQQVGQYVEDLDCTQCEVLTSQVFTNLNEISSCFTNLKRLSLPIEPATEVKDITAYFLSLSKLFPNLEAIENISSLNNELSINVLECQSYFPHLTVLNDKPCASFGRISEVLRFRNNEKREDWYSNLEKVSQSCQHITEYRCTKGTGYINLDGLKKIGTQFHKLNKLEMRLCSANDDAITELFSICTKNNFSDLYFEKPGHVTDTSLTTIASNCPHLKKIKLSRCSEITRKGLKVLSSKCQEIISLHINNSTGWGTDNTEVDQIDDECLQAVVENCKAMEIFRILYTSKMTYKAVEFLRINCYHIRALMFFECPGVEDRALQELSNMKCLKRLVIVHTKATPKGVLNFIIGAPCLNSLTLYCNMPEFGSNMSDLGEEIYNQIDAESSNYRPNTLRSLTVRGVGSAFVQLITVLSPNLLSLDLRDSGGISTTSLKSVLVNCENLEVFDISSLPTLDPSFLTAVAESGKFLRKLSLGSSVQTFRNEHFQDVITSSPCLEMISMDTFGSDISIEQLASDIRCYHGGHCKEHIDPECDRDPEFNHKFISFHFVAKIYLDSISKF